MSNCNDHSKTNGIQATNTINESADAKEDSTPELTTPTTTSTTPPPSSNSATDEASTGGNALGIIIQKLVQIENKVDRMEKKVQKVDERMDRMEKKVDVIEKKVDVIEQTVEKNKQTVERIDLRMGHLVEDMVTSKLDTKKVSLTNPYDLIKMIAPEVDEHEVHLLAVKVNEHLYRHCTKDLLNKIVGKEIPYKKREDWSIQQWEHAFEVLGQCDFDVPKMKKNLNIDENLTEDHCKNLRWSWERASYEFLKKEKKNYLHNSPQHHIINQFIQMIEEGVADGLKKWQAVAPITNISNMKGPMKETFLHDKAKKYLINNREGLVASLMFVDQNLNEWTNRDGWALSEIDFDGFKHEYADEYMKIITILEIKSAEVSKDKAKKQLQFRAHLLDEYANIAWDGKTDKPGMFMHLKTYIYDTDKNNWNQKNETTKVDEEFKMAKSVVSHIIFDELN